MTPAQLSISDSLDAANAPAEPASSRVVICVDPIATALLKHVTPDISWEAYVPWLRYRRPDLEVVYLNQPHDWFSILTRRAQTYEQLLEQMVIETLAHMNRRWDEVVILGFSLGGLTALRVALEVARLEQQLTLNYVAFVTLGTPWGATGRQRRDTIFRRLPFDYFSPLFDTENNQRMLKELCLFGYQGRLRLMFGEVIGDEIVTPTSALLPLDWITQWQPGGDVQARGFRIRNHGAWLRHHDGLLYDSAAIGFIDGLVDGMLPPTEPRDYEPFVLREWRRKLRET